MGRLNGRTRWGATKSAGAGATKSTNSAITHPIGVTSRKSWPRLASRAAEAFDANALRSLLSGLPPNCLRSRLKNLGLPFVRQRV